MWERQGNLAHRAHLPFGREGQWYDEGEVSRSSGTYVRWLQESLNRLINANLSVDGKAGPVTRAAVMDFQQRNGIHVDGIVGPETERALIARGASLPPDSGTAPPPISAPLPLPSGGLRSAIVRVAREEWERWDRGNRKETDPAMLPVLREYWAAVGKRVTVENLARTAFQEKMPWSAAFVSWVMKQAGAGTSFTYNSYHATYMLAAKNNRARNLPNTFKAYRINEMSPAPGDVIVRWRNRNRQVNFDNVTSTDPTHGDIVVGREGNNLIIIGGNACRSKGDCDTVAMNRVSVDASGRITDSRYFAVLKAPEAESATVIPLPAPAVTPSTTSLPSGFFKDLPALRNTPLTPQQPITVPTSGRARNLAATYNRLGGLISVLATQLGVEVAAILAVWYIESAGRAHTPGSAVIRFENHLFFKLWGNSRPEIYDRHFRHGGHNGVDGKGWKYHQFRENSQGVFEPCHKSQSHEYRVLNFARRLDNDAALKSISIGGPQILINNYSTIGYATPLAMYEAFQQSERYHVLGFVDFCVRRSAPKHGDMVKHLRNKDWRSFSRYYNGTGQIDLYSEKLRGAYEDAKMLPIDG